MQAQIRLRTASPLVALFASLSGAAAVDRVNADLLVIEKVCRFILVDEPFTVENQQLTPSIKIRRHVLKDVYGARLDALYKR